jgi:NAD(P)-dependent dehydrogenase (short-subunit alcohol dehydrogenase family)
VAPNGVVTAPTRVADVAFGYHSNAAEAEAAQFDATSLASLRTWVSAVIGTFGRVDILAKCCGWRGPFALFKDQDPDD